MNEDLAGSILQELGRERLRFFRTDVSSTESVRAAVQGSIDWLKQTGKELGGVIAVAGVANPSKVRVDVPSICNFPPLLVAKDAPQDYRPTWRTFGY